MNVMKPNKLQTKSEDFIINELTFFIKIFPDAHARYEYDKNAFVHVVEILPNAFFYNDKDYISWEDDVYHRFVSLFPTENICFVSDDAIVGVEKAEYTIEGMRYRAGGAFLPSSGAIAPSRK